MIHANSDANYRPALDRIDGIQFAKRLPVWVGVASIAVAVKLSRSLIDMLTEASAEFGEWGIARMMRRGRRLSQESEFGCPQFRSDDEKRKLLILTAAQRWILHRLVSGTVVQSGLSRYRGHSHPISQQNRPG